MKIKNFKDMYIAELQKLMSMESQIDIALKRMADAASHPSLKRTVAAPRRDEGAEQAPAIDPAEARREIARSHRSAMEALLNETEKTLWLLEDDTLRGSGLIASAQKLEHYEIAAYAQRRPSPVSSSFVTTNACCTIALKKNGRPTPHSPNSPRAK